MQVNSNYNNLKLQARQSNLLSYLESIGYIFIREGKHYRCQEHTSLIVTPPNAFYWNSRNDGGNSIDFLVRHLGYNFKDAVEQLTNMELEQQKSPSQTPSEKGNYIIDNSLLNRAYGYLIRSRGIQYNIVSDLVKKGYIDMVNKGPYKHPVVGFKVFNEKGDPIGYEVQGTFDKVRFKGVTSDTKYGYGFNIVKGKPDKAFFFESAIDLISFIQLCKAKQINVDIDNSILVSLAGLKKATIKNTLKAFKVSSNPIICVDQDNAGLEFKEMLKAEQMKFKEIIPSHSYKDWNDMLNKING